MISGHWTIIIAYIRAVTLPVKNMSHETILISSALLLFQVFQICGRIQTEKMMVEIQPSIAAIFYLVDILSANVALQ
jgi:hypothetical protein